MNNIILTSKVCLPSAKLLRDKLEIKYNNKLIVTTNIDKAKDKLLFSYGRCINNNPLNSSSFINMCSNKNKLSDLLNDHGIYSPKFINDKLPKEDDYPILIRETLTGHGGIGIHIVENDNDFMRYWLKEYYWTKFIITEFELRVHVFDNNIIKIFKKEFNSDDIKEPAYPIRNINNGYHFSSRNIDKYPKVISLIKDKLNNILNGVHYGIDLGYDIDKKEYIIYEINTGCGLNDDTASIYADLIYNKLNNIQ